VEGAVCFDDACCQPDCEGKECGDDGCGGSCGECDAGECQAGTCVLPEVTCASLVGSFTNLGCNFVTVDLDVYTDPFVEPPPDDAPHALLLVNEGEKNANYQVTTDAAGITINDGSGAVPPGGSVQVDLPVMSCDGTGVFDRTASVVSDRPIAVYQVNPVAPEASANGSSLLLPVESLGVEYRILTWPTEPIEQGPMDMESQHGYFAVVAAEAGETQVTVQVPVNTELFAPEGGKLVPGQSYDVTLQHGEVAQFAASGEVGNEDYDLSGAHVVANKKVAVFAGHEEAVVCPAGTEDSCCADHIEEQLLPLNQWSTEFQCVKAKPRSASDMDIWRVQAGEPGVTLNTIPNVPGLDEVTLENAGDFAQGASGESFLLIASGPVQVAQYLVGKECSGGDVGDPAMMTMVPVPFFRQHYLVVPPPDYPEDYVSIVKAPGTFVYVNGEQVPGDQFETVAVGAYAAGYVEIDDEGALIECEAPCAVYSYGYHPVAAYGHAAGMGK